MATYEAFYNSKRTTLQADGLYAAKQAAIAHFKPSKRTQHMVSVVLVATDSGPVALNNSNADLG